MTIDMISSIQNICNETQKYNNINNVNVNVAVNNAINFDKMVKQQFNNIIKTPIDQQFPININFDNNCSNKNTVLDIAQTIRTTLNNYEQKTQESVIGKASIVDVLTSSTEVKNLIDVTVKIREKLMESWDKIININI